MNAGRERDALVAEKVMEWDVGDIFYDETHQEIMPRVPRYSTSIADAWPLVEKLSGQFAVNLSCTSQPVRWLCEFSRSENVWFNAHGRTPAEAICLAALKAVGYPSA